MDAIDKTPGTLPQWPDRDVGLDRLVFWATFAEELNGLVGRCRLDPSLLDGYPIEDVASEAFIRTKRRCDADEELFHRLHIGRTRASFAVKCLKYIQLERVRLVGKARRKRSELLEAAPDRGTDIDTDPANTTIAREQMTDVAKLASDDDRVRLVVQAHTLGYERALRLYQSDLGVSARTARRHYLSGLAKLGRVMSVESERNQPNRSAESAEGRLDE